MPATSRDSGGEVSSEQKLARAARLGHAIARIPFQGPQPLQRRLTVTQGQELPVRNVALASMGKANGIRPSAAYGETPSVFNQQEFPPAAEDQLLTAFTVDTEEALGRFRTTLQVPNQRVSWVMELPTGGPWEAPNKLAAEFVLAQIEQDMTVAPQHPIRALEGQVKVIAEGRPDDDTLVSQITAHEYKHVKNTLDVVREVLKPWDDNLEAYSQEIATRTSLDPLSMALGVRAEVPTATATVSRQMGREIKRRDVAYHESPAGRDPKIVDFKLEGKKGSEVVRLGLRLDKV